MAASAINMNPDRPTLDGRELGRLVALYLTDTRLRMAAPSTIANYGYLLAYLLTWWGEAGPGLGYVLDVHTWALFEQWLQGRSTRSGASLAPSTQKSILARCRQVLRWAYRWSYVDRDFSDQIPRPKGEQLQRRGPGLADLRGLLDAAGATRAGVRDQALVGVLIGTGIRRAEAAGLDVCDLQFHADGGGGITVRRAKLNKPRRVAFDFVAGGYLAAWLDKENRQTGALFVGWKGQRLGVRSIYRIVKQACKLAGIDERGRGPHDLRRAFATEWTRTRRGLGDGQLLAQQLGHSSAKMSLHYSGLNFDDLADGFTSPLSQI